MLTLTYYFDKITYTLAEMPSDGADLTLRWPDSHWPPRFWGTLHYKADASSTITTPTIPRFFNAITINWQQKRYQSIILTGKGKSAFKKLQAHFDARKMNENINES